MRTFKSICATLTIGILTISCQGDNGKLQNVPLEKGEEFATGTELEREVKRFFETYDTRISYQWDRYAFAKDAVADPSGIEDVLPYMEIMEEVFFKALKAVQEDDKDFVRNETPINFLLLGSGINYGGSESFGERTVGQAGNIQPNRLTLGGLNSFGTVIRSKSENPVVPDLDAFNFEALSDSDKKFLNAVLEKSTSSYPNQGGLVSFLYHELTHYIDSKHDIPKDFEKPAQKNYLRGTNSYRQLSTKTANDRGFMLAYGMQNEAEDFATYVHIMLWKPKKFIEDNYLTSEATKLKIKMVYEYYLNLGIDLYKLRDYIHSNEMKIKLLTIKRKYER